MPSNLPPPSWPDLPNINVVTRPLGGNSAQCVIRFRGKEKVNLLLLSDGMFSLLSHDMAQKQIDEVVVALGRVIVAHVASSPDSIGEDRVRQDLRQLENTSTITGPMTWADLPDASVTHFAAPTNTIYCGLRAGHEVAIFVSTRDPELIFSWARFSTRTPDHSFLLAFGRVVISNTQVVRYGTHRR